jgi:hypothetical protein
VSATSLPATGNLTTELLVALVSDSVFGATVSVEPDFDFTGFTFTACAKTAVEQKTEAVTNSAMDNLFFIFLLSFSAKKTTGLY